MLERKLESEQHRGMCLTDTLLRLRDDFDGFGPLSTADTPRPFGSPLVLFLTYRHASDGAP